MTDFMLRELEAIQRRHPGSLIQIGGTAPDYCVGGCVSESGASGWVYLPKDTVDGR